MSFKNDHYKNPRLRGVATVGHPIEFAAREQTKVCSLCRRGFKPREDEKQWEFNKRVRCQEPDCREHATATGILVPVKYTSRRRDVPEPPPIPNAAQWGFRG